MKMTEKIGLHVTLMWLPLHGAERYLCLCISCFKAISIKSWPWQWSSIMFVHAFHKSGFH